MRQISLSLLLMCFLMMISADEKVNQIRTLQTHGLDFVEKEYRLSSEIYSADKEGQIWLEAEASYLLSFYPNGNTIKNEKCSGGSGIVDVMSASYKVKLNQSIKSYEVWARVHYLKTGEYVINSFVDGNVLNAKSTKVSIAEKDLNRWLWLKINAITSTEEYRKLTISAKGQSILLDKVLVAPGEKINTKLILEAGLGSEPVKTEAEYGEWLSEQFRPAGVRLWKSVKIKARNEDARLFKVYFRTKSKDWTILNKDHSLDLKADDISGDFIQFKIKFSKKDEVSSYFEKLELVYEVNLSVLKSVQNSNAEIQTSFINGKIYSIINKVTGKSYIPQDRGVMPFLLYSKNEDGELMEIDENDFYPSKPEIVDLKNGKFALKISYRGETTGLKVDYKLTVESNSDLINAELNIRGKGNVTIAGVDFPRLQNVVLSPTWESDHVIFPLSGGLKVDAPAAGAYLNNSYPEECSLPWLDIAGENGGIFLYYPDYHETKKSVSLKVYHNVTMDGIHMAFFHQVEDPSKIQLNSVMVLHDKNWHAGAEKYKSFVENAAKKNEKVASEVESYGLVLSPFEDAITEYSAEQNVLLKYLNVNHAIPTLNSEKIANLKDVKEQVKLSRLVSLSDLNIPKNSSDVYMLDSFGDNAEIFQFCYPDKKLMGKVYDSMTLKELQNYYKRNWIYNRVVPVFGNEGREMSLLQSRVKPFFDTLGQKSKFLDDLGLEGYQTEELMLKRYDYSDADKKVICILYYHDGNPKKVSLLLNNIGKINNIYHTSIGKPFEEILFQYVDNQLKFEVPSASQPFGALLLSLGGAGKEMLYGQAVQDKITPKVNQISVSLINFSNALARVKLTFKDKNSTEELKINMPELVELKAGEAKIVPCSITNFNDLQIAHEVEVIAVNLANNQSLSLNTFIVPNVLNSNFSLNNGKNADYWSSIMAFDSYTGNNKKGSILFDGKSNPFKSILFLKSNSSYQLNYFFNVSGKERGFEFNFYFLNSLGGKSAWQKVSLKGKKSNEFDFWQTESLEFKTPVDLQSCYIEIVSPSSIGKIWLDDLSIIEN